MGFFDLFKKKTASVADAAAPVENSDNASVPTNEAVSNEMMPQPPVAPSAPEVAAPDAPAAPVETAPEAPAETAPEVPVETAPETPSTDTLPPAAPAQ